MSAQSELSICTLPCKCVPEAAFFLAPPRQLSALLCGLKGVNIHNPHHRFAELLSGTKEVCR